MISAGLGSKRARKSREVRRELRLQQVSALKTLTKLDTRTLPPWEWSRPKASLPLHKRLKDKRAAINILRTLGPSSRIHTLQCAIRCNYARALYLSGRFDKASDELNRAHGFGVHATGPEGHDALGEYHLHRAEYSLFRSMHDQRASSSRSKSRQMWLLDAKHALASAESQLRLGERSASRWLWFYVLSAWYYRQELKRIREGEITARELEDALFTGLRSIAGGLLNTPPDSTPAVSLDGLWCDLRSEWIRAKQPTHSRSQWFELNVRAGLESYLLQQQDRLLPDARATRITVVLSRKERVLSRLIDFNGLGAGLAGPVGLPNDRPWTAFIAFRRRPLFRARVRFARQTPDASLVGVTFEQLSINKRLQLMKMPGTPRGRRPRHRRELARRVQ